MITSGSKDPSFHNLTDSLASSIGGTDGTPDVRKAAKLLMASEKPPELRWVVEGCAAGLLRYRRHMEAGDILILTDIKKKHSSHALTADVDIVETAKAAEFFSSDVVIITVTSTGNPADLYELRLVSASVKIPVLVGSGITLENVQEYLMYADALIVGSYFKEEESWEGTVSLERTRALMEKVARLR